MVPMDEIEARVSPRLNECRQCFGRMVSFPSSPAGLTRGSILFARRWIAGSSPAMTLNSIDSTETRISSVGR
jgi:hypothetical protein